MENREDLLAEMEEFIANVQKYHEALEQKDEEKLCKLLKEGRICKEDDIRMEEEQQNKK